MLKSILILPVSCSDEPQIVINQRRALTKKLRAAGLEFARATIGQHERPALIVNAGSFTVARDVYLHLNSRLALDDAYFRAPDGEVLRMVLGSSLDPLPKVRSIGYWMEVFPPCVGEGLTVKFAGRHYSLEGFRAPERLRA